MSQVSGAAPAADGPPKIVKSLVGMIPWAIISGLLYAGLFIHPKPVGEAVIPPSIERNDLLFGVTKTGTSTVWIAGNFGKILRSDDNAKSWTPQSSGTESHLQDIEAWDVQHAVAVGNGATLIRTEDGGATWRAVEYEHSDIANKLFRVKTLPNGEAWAVGEFGALLRTTDYGATWTQMRKAWPTPDSSRDPQDMLLDDIYAADPNNIIVVGEYGKTMRSTDGGKTWEDIQSSSSSSLESIEFRDPKNGVIVGLDGVLLHTEDGGATWKSVSPEVSGNKQHLFGVKWDEANSEWLAVGAKGVYVSANADFTKVSSGKISESDLSARTKIIFVDGKAVIGGASPGIWDRKEWIGFGGRR